MPENRLVSADVFSRTFHTGKHQILHYNTDRSGFWALVLFNNITTWVLLSYSRLIVIEIVSINNPNMTKHCRAGSSRI